MLSSVDDLEVFVQMEADALLKLESVLIITPGHVNGSDTWKMETLKSVWTAEEPSAPGQLVDIFETLAGVTYARSMLETPVESLHNKTLRFSWVATSKMTKTNGYH